MYYMYKYIYNIHTHYQHAIFPILSQESSQFFAWLSSSDSARHCQNFLGRR